MHKISQTGDLAKGLRILQEFDFGGQSLITELTELGKQTLEGHNKHTMYSQDPRRKEQ